MDANKYKLMPFNYKLARFSLLLHKAYPFLGELCMRVEKYKKEMDGIAATDGIHIFLNEERMNELPEESVNHILLHELMHIILRQRFPKDLPFYAKMYWNIACDLVANWVIQDMEYSLKRHGIPVQPIAEAAVCGDDLSEDPSNLILKAFIEQVLQQGLTSENPPALLHIQWKSFDKIVPNDGSYIFDLLSETETEEEEVAQADVEQLIAESAKAAGNEGIPEALRQSIEELTKGRKLPWHIIFKRYLEAILGSEDYDFCPPDKRMLYSGMILPAESEDDKVLNDALIVLDVSSSVDRDELLKQLWQIRSILIDFQFTGTIISFASSVEQEAMLTDKASLKRFISALKVGGGTDWSDVVDYVKQSKQKMKPIVVFTDGYLYSFDKGLSDVVFITQDRAPYQLSELGKVIQVKE